MSPYNYAAGNPISLFDPDGAVPFDLFPDEKSAMKDYANKYNLTSGMERAEFATVPIDIIGPDGKSYVSYVPPLEFSAGNADPRYVKRFYDNQKANNLLKIEFTWRNSDAHSHADGSVGTKYENGKMITFANFFSPLDIKSSISDGRSTTYVTTPGGQLWQFDVINNKFNLISDQIPKYEDEWKRGNMAEKIRNIQDDKPLPLYIRKIIPKTGKERFVLIPDIREMYYDTDPKHPNSE